MQYDINNFFVLQDPLMDFFKAENEVIDTPEYYQAEISSDPFVSPLDIIKKRRTSTDGNGKNSYKKMKYSVLNKKDECTIYGEYIAEKLRKLDEISRAQAQHKVNNILYEIEMEFFKKARDNNATVTETADTLTFDNSLSPFQPSPKHDYDEEEDECSE